MKTVLELILAVFLNAIAHGVFLAAACFLADRHPVMAAWCIVGAFLSGYSFKSSETTEQKAK